jgi:hypothetical protein
MNSKLAERRPSRPNAVSRNRQARRKIRWTAEGTPFRSDRRRRGRHHAVLAEKQPEIRPTEYVGKSRKGKRSPWSWTFVFDALDLLVGASAVAIWLYGFYGWVWLHGICH